MEIIHRGGCAFRKSVLLSRFLKRKGEMKHLSTTFVGFALWDVFPTWGWIHTEPPILLSRAPARYSRLAAGRTPWHRHLVQLSVHSFGRAELRNPSPGSDSGGLGKLPMHKPQKGQGVRQPGGGGGEGTNKLQSWSSLNSSFLNFWVSFFLFF